MNKYQVLSAIAEFSDYGECTVVKQADWNALVDWVKSLPEEVLTDRPNFDVLPVIFRKEIEEEDCPELAGDGSNYDF